MSAASAASTFTAETVRAVRAVVFHPTAPAETGAVLLKGQLLGVIVEDQLGLLLGQASGCDITVQLFFQAGED